MAEEKKGKPEMVKIKVTAKREIYGPNGAMVAEGKPMDGKEDGKKSTGEYLVSKTVADFFIKRKEAVKV